MASATTALTLPCNDQGAKVLPPGIWMTLCPMQLYQDSLQFASPCPYYLLWAKGKTGFYQQEDKQLWL